MNRAIKQIIFDFRRALICAALSTITTLAVFSLIANIMPPLMTDGLTLASATMNVCVPESAFGLLQTVSAQKHSAI
ncbi:MAG: hypothetical protein ABI854_03180 [Betaproteobacteria bacterium]